jgi:hypothetical protein
VRVGGARPPPFITFTITNKVAVYAPAEWAECTCCLYGAGRNDFDAEKSSFEGHWKGWALKIKNFLGPEMVTSEASAHPTEQFRNQQLYEKCVR